MSEIYQYFMIMTILGSVCFMMVAGVAAYLALKLVEVHKTAQSALTLALETFADEMGTQHRLSQAALSHAVLNAAEMVKATSLSEKVSNDISKDQMLANMKILEESIEEERRKNPLYDEDHYTPPKSNVKLADGRVINMEEWSRL